MGDGPGSAIVGMPRIAVDRAKQVMIIKRGMSVGSAGNDNPICYNENSYMLFGNAKNMIELLVKEIHNT